MSTVSDVSKAFTKQRNDMLPCIDLMGGTESMRRAGTRYLDKGAQSQAEFDDRLKRTVLLNVYRRTLNFLRGQVFQNPVSIGSDNDALTDEQTVQFKQWAEDVDLRGKNITTWSGGVFRQGLQDGVTFVVVDYSAVQTRTNDAGVTEYLAADGVWRPKTKAADQSEGWRPYLVRVDAGQVLDMWGSSDNGRPMLDSFRYVETVMVQDDEWSQKPIQQIRVFRRENGRVVWEIYRNEVDNSGSYALVDSGVLSIDEIPVAMFMPGDQRTDYTAEPALIDLANLNIRHWQVSSNHAEMMEFVQRPVWFASGVEMKDDNGTPIAFGAGRMISCSDSTASLQSVGVDGGSYASSREELRALEDSMAMYGLQLLQPKSGSITATESMRDTEENNSTLRNWAADFQDFLENVMRLVGKWWGMDDGVSVSVNTDFARAVDIAMLLNFQRAGILSRDAVLLAARDSGLLPDDFDVEADAERMARDTMGNGTDTGVKSLARFINNSEQKI